MSEAAMCAVASAGRFSLSLITDHRDYDCSHSSKQNQRNDDRAEIVSQPCKHCNQLPCVRSFSVSVVDSLYFLMNNI